MRYAQARRFGSFAAACVVSGVLAGPASGDALRASDPDDAPGRLDVRLVAHGHWRSGDTRQRLITHTLATHETWRNRILRTRGQIELWFDVDDDPEFERRLSIGVIKGSLYAQMDGGSKEGTLGYAKVWRPGPRSVKVRFPESLFGVPELQTYRWHALTEIVCQETDHVTVLCLDNAPARGTQTSPGRVRPLTHPLY